MLGIGRLARNLTSAGGMLRHQGRLQKLPVPPLHKTLEKYLKTVQPFLTHAEFNITQGHVEEFGRKGGLGEVLQQRLEERSKSLPQGWLIDWWNQLAYFGYRDPVVINVNYFFQFQDDRSFPTQTGRAASLIKAAMAFKGMIQRDEVEPEMMKDSPLCMSQYKYLFNSCRVPLPGTDETLTYDPSHNHIIVMRRNHFFRVDLVQGGEELSLQEIEAQLQAVIREADRRGPAPPVGLLTCANRDVFASARTKLLAEPSNAGLLECIQSAAFMVCLDTSSPASRTEVGRALWHGDGRNRYFDKNFQIIVFENGKAGFNGEHSMMDGTPTNRLTDFMLEALAAGKISHGSPRPGRSATAPAPLQFALSAEVLKTLEETGRSFDETVAAHDHSVLPFLAFGKNAIKRFKISPDAFVQMSIQLAHYKMFGHLRATYESAATRKFLNGRTEVVRTVSTPSVEWVNKMLTTASPVEKYQLLKKATDAHVTYMNEAVDAHGVDRHLLGLRMLCREGEEPAIFKDPAFKRSSHWGLSTSQITSERYDGYGWGEVVPDGFGVAYMIKNNSLHYNVACLKALPYPGSSSPAFPGAVPSPAAALAHYLEESLLEMKAVCESAIPSKL